MQQLILVIHVMVCIGIVALVLIQHGKGADVGAAFGSGASGTVFGSQGSGSFLLKLTSFLAAVFFSTCLVLGYMASKQTRAPDGLDLPDTPINIPVSGQNIPGQSTNNNGLPQQEGLFNPQNTRQSVGLPQGGTDRDSTAN